MPHLTVGGFTMTGVPLFLFALPVSSWKMNRKAEGRWLGTSLCDNERTIALRKNALRAYEGKSSELIPPGPRSRVGTKAILSLQKNTSYNIITYPYIISHVIIVPFSSAFERISL